MRKYSPRIVRITNTRGNHLAPRQQPIHQQNSPKQPVPFVFGHAEPFPMSVNASESKSKRIIVFQIEKLSEKCRTNYQIETLEIDLLEKVPIVIKSVQKLLKQDILGIKQTLESIPRLFPRVKFLRILLSKIQKYDEEYYFEILTECFPCLNQLWSLTTLQIYYAGDQDLRKCLVNLKHTINRKVVYMTLKAEVTLFNSRQHLTQKALKKMETKFHDSQLRFTSRIKYNILVEFHKVKEWKCLALSCCPGISDNIFEKLRPMYLSRLRVISFVNRNISSTELLFVVNAPCLQKIDLSNNEITTVWPLRKMGCQKLRQLYLHSNFFEEIHFMGHIIWSSLEELQLDRDSQYCQSQSLSSLSKYTPRSKAIKIYTKNKHRIAENLLKQKVKEKNVEIVDR